VIMFVSIFITAVLLYLSSIQQNWSYIST
jgi:hypothetical protein